MKKAALWVLLIFSGACCFAWLSSVWADGPDDPPEFFFTRLAYSENPTGCCRHRGGFRGFGGRGSLTMPIPPQFVCPEFGGRNFFPRQGWGWGTDYPGGDCKFMGGIHRLTGMRDETDPRIYGMKDDTGRVMVVATYNSDMGDAWEYMDLACYPEKYSGEAYRVGLNFMIYAMTH